MKKIILSILLFLSIYTYSSEQEYKDSLLHIINTSQNDTIYLETLNNYALLIKYYQLDSSIYYSNQVIEKCKKHKYGENISLDNKIKNIGLRAYNNNLIFYRRNNNLSEAINVFKECIDNNYNDSNSIQTAYLYSNYANVLVKTSNIKEAYDYYIKSKEIYQTHNDTVGLSAIYFHIGRMYYNENDFQSSIKYTLQALNLLKKIKSKRQTAFCFNSLASSYSSIAEEYEKDKRDSIYKLGVKYYKLSLNIKEEFNEYNGQLVTLNNLVEIYSNLGEYSKALEYANRALQLSQKLNNVTKEILSTIHLCRLYLSKKDYNKALEYGLKAHQLSKETNNIDFTGRSAKLLSKIYKQKKNYNKALEYYEIFTQINDSIQKQKHLESLNTFEETYKYKKKSIEDSLNLNQQEKILQLERTKNKVEKAKKETTRNWLLTIIISLVLIGFFIIKNLRNQSKARISLTHKNVKIQEQNKNLIEQKEELTDMNKSLKKAYQDKVDSIKYAKRIQTTTFPTEKSIKEALPESFIIYKPLDIVSGDFYWIRQLEDNVVIAIGDSIGHGVPGAFLSIMGIAILKEMVNNTKELIASEIMNNVRTRIIESLQHYKTEDPEKHYGMDLGIIILNKTKNTLQFSGANTPLYIIKDPNNIEDNAQMLTIIKADKMPISLYPKMEPFTNHICQLNKNDKFYMHTDGAIDQLGGKDGKKIGQKNFVDYLTQTSLLDINEQKEKLDKYINDWKFSFDKNAQEHYLQTDDITILGVKI